MVLERFLSWVAAAPAQARMGAARSLVAAYSRPESEAVRREHLDRMIAVLLDDTAVPVRIALAEAAAISTAVPRHVVVALSRDTSTVAIPVLQASKLLNAADLAAALAMGDDAVQQAVASRIGVPADVSAILAGEAPLDAILVLCENPSADISATSLRRILDRFGAESAVREAILNRDDLDADVRHDLVVATARTLSVWAMSCGLMTERRAECVVKEEIEKAVVTIAAGCQKTKGPPDLFGFVTYLRTEDRLTPAVLLRSLLCGETALFEATLGQLAGMSAGRVAGLARAPSSLAFSSLYTKAALPPALLPLFRSAVAAAIRFDARGRREAPAVIPEAVAYVRAAVASRGDQSGLIALLDRLQSEGLRDDTRRRRHVFQVPSQSVTRTDIPVFTMPSRPVFRLPFRSAA